MRRLLALVIILAALCGPSLPVQGQALPCGLVRSPVAYEYESITVDTTAIGFTATKLNSGSNTAAAVRVTQEVDVMRYRTDGTAPTSTEGHKRSSTDTGLWFCHNFSGIKFIRDTSSTGSGALKVTYYRRG